MCERGVLPSAVLLGGAAAAIAVALLADLRSAEHPTHLAVLALVVIVIRLWCRHRFHYPTSAWMITAGALATQPLLHHGLPSPQPPAGAHQHGDLVHVLLSDSPSALVQILAPLVVLVVITAAGGVLLVRTAVRSPLLPPPGEWRIPPGVEPVPAWSRFRGMLLSWCGWALIAALRGPPGHRLRAAS